MVRSNRPGVAFVRQPSPRLAEGELTFLDRVPMDVERAVDQHAAYCDVLRALGLDVVTFMPAPDLADAVFVEDAAVIVSDRAILTRPGAASRRPEVASVVDDLQAAGLSVAAIEDPATLDGGDVLQVGSTIYVGRSSRTNQAGIDQLAALLGPLDRRVVGVDVTAALHLKTVATALPDGSIIAVPAALDAGRFAEPVHPAPEPAGANVLTVGNTVVVSAAAPATAAWLRGRGLDTVVVDIGEFEKVEAGLTCLSLLAPALR